MPIAAASYAGPVAGRDAVLCEFAVGSPSLSDAFGGDGVEGSWFTLFLVTIDDPGFRRLTVHPKTHAERAWWNRLLGRHMAKAGADALWPEITAA